MGMVNDEIVRIAERRRGLVTRDQLTELGLSKRVVAKMVGAAFLHPIQDPAVVDVFRLGAGPLDFEQRVLALCLGVPRAVVSHGSCSQLWGLRRGLRNQLEIAVDHRAKVTVPHVVVHRTNGLHERDVVHRLDGIRLTSPARLVFDLAGVLDLGALRSLTEDALNRRLLTPESLHDVGERLLGRGRRGTRTFRELLELHPGHVAPVGSELELRFEEALLAAGLHPTRQVVVSVPGGETIRLDFGFLPERVGIEIDHWTWHGDRASVQRDKSRDVALARHGWTSLRFTDDDVVDRLPSCIGSVSEVLTVRQRQLGLRPTG